MSNTTLLAEYMHYKRATEELDLTPLPLMFPNKAKYSAFSGGIILDFI
jgi:hypothetical protein